MDFLISFDWTITDFRDGDILLTQFENYFIKTSPDAFLYNSLLIKRDVNGIVDEIQSLKHRKAVYNGSAFRKPEKFTSYSLHGVIVQSNEIRKSKQKTILTKLEALLEFMSSRTLKYVLETCEPMIPMYSLSNFIKKYSILILTFKFYIFTIFYLLLIESN